MFKRFGLATGVLAVGLYAYEAHRVPAPRLLYVPDAAVDACREELRTATAACAENGPDFNATAANSAAYESPAHQLVRCFAGLNPPSHVYLNCQRVYAGPPKLTVTASVPHH